jgi:hypothetical protein
MMSLLEDTTSADVTFVVNGEKIGAHYAVVSARSPVFKSMFTLSMKEGKERSVEIRDVFVDTAVFKELLRYVYTGSYSKVLEENATEMIILANKYIIPGLVAACEKLLIGALEINNAIDIYVQTYLIPTSCLNSYIVWFMASNLTEIFKTEGFSRLVKYHPHLIPEIQSKCSQLHQITKKRKFPDS